jgi:hypothetical protein
VAFNLVVDPGRQRTSKHLHPFYTQMTKSMIQIKPVGNFVVNPYALVKLLFQHIPVSHVTVTAGNVLTEQSIVIGVDGKLRLSQQ